MRRSFLKWAGAAKMGGLMIRRLWCRLVHDHRKMLLPIHGWYICGRCQCRFPVPWEQRTEPVAMAESME